MKRIISVLLLRSNSIIKSSTTTLVCSTYAVSYFIVAQVAVANYADPATFCFGMGRLAFDFDHINRSPIWTTEGTHEQWKQKWNGRLHVACMLPYQQYIKLLAQLSGRLS